MTINNKIKELINGSEIILFMKGNPKFPQCGFSSLACQILDATGSSYETVDVLQDPEIREGVKVFSSWPTVPQLYIKGEFVGGADIMREMNESGELSKIISQA